MVDHEISVIERNAFVSIVLQDSMIDPAQFTFDRFFRFYTFLMDRQEIDRLFNSLSVSPR